MITELHTSKPVNRGFTIVELLIVIVVIAILATITIVAYNGIQDRARASAASQGLSNALKKILYWQTQEDTASAPSTLAIAGVSDTESLKFQYNPNLSGTYCITATVGNKSYKATGTNKTPVEGGCAGHGQGGIAAITNWAVDPNAATSASSNFSVSGSSIAPSTNTIASDRAHAGSTSLKKSITGAAANGNGAKVSTPGLTLAASEPLSWSFWIYSTRAGTIVPIVEGYRISDSGYTNCTNAAASIPANSWTKIQGSCSMGSSTNVAGAGAYNLAVQAGDTLWFDEFMVTKGATQYTFADGSSTDWDWNGTPNNSTSTGPPLQ